MMNRELVYVPRQSTIVWVLKSWEAPGIASLLFVALLDQAKATTKLSNLSLDEIKLLEAQFSEDKWERAALEHEYAEFINGFQFVRKV